MRTALRVRCETTPCTKPEQSSRPRPTPKRLSNFRETKESYCKERRQNLDSIKDSVGKFVKDEWNSRLSMLRKLHSFAREDFATLREFCESEASYAKEEKKRDEEKHDSNPYITLDNDVPDSKNDTKSK
jgi:hypothetical protein